MLDRLLFTVISMFLCIGIEYNDFLLLFFHTSSAFNNSVFRVLARRPRDGLHRQWPPSEFGPGPTSIDTETIPSHISSPSALPAWQFRLQADRNESASFCLTTFLIIQRRYPNISLVNPNTSSSEIPSYEGSKVVSSHQVSLSYHLSASCFLNSSSQSSSAIVAWPRACLLHFFFCLSFLFTYFNTTSITSSITSASPSSITSSATSFHHDRTLTFILFSPSRITFVLYFYLFASFLR